MLIRYLWYTAKSVDDRGNAVENWPGADDFCDEEPFTGLECEPKTGPNDGDNPYDFWNGEEPLAVAGEDLPPDSPVPANLRKRTRPRRNKRAEMLGKLREIRMRKQKRKR